MAATDEGGGGGGVGSAWSSDPLWGWPVGRGWGTSLNSLPLYVVSIPIATVGGSKPAAQCSGVNGGVAILTT